MDEKSWELFCRGQAVADQVNFFASYRDHDASKIHLLYLLVNLIYFPLWLRIWNHDESIRLMICTTDSWSALSNDKCAGFFAGRSCCYLDDGCSLTIQMYLVYFLAGLVIFLCLIRKITSFRESLRSVRYASVTWSIVILKNSIRYLPGYRDLFAPFSLVGLFSPQIPYFCGSLDLHFNEKHTRMVHRIFCLGGANADFFSFCQSWLGCHLIGMLRVVRLPAHTDF